MELIIKLTGQILFALATIIFTIYSIMAIYTFNKYGHPKSLTTTLSLVYSGVVLGLISWGFVVITKI
jgi:hypothetical protein